MLKSIALLAVFLLLGSSIFANEGDYNYPYKNADVATLTTAIMKSRHQETFKSIKFMDVGVVPGREKTFLFEKRSELKFGFYAQKQAAPLVFLIADIANTHVTGYMLYMADLLQEQGYNVVTLSSQLSWNFVISSSQTGIPGVTSEDATDMYKALQIVLNKVKKNHSKPITKTAVIGFGFGGLLAAHISSLDEQQKALNIDRYVLVNPVVNVVHAITQIETRASIAHELGDKRVQKLKSQAFNFVYNNLSSTVSAMDSQYFLNLETKFPLPEKEYEFLTGALLRLNVGDTIFATQLVNDIGVLKSKLTRYNQTDRHNEVNEFGLSGYLKQFILPYFSTKYSKVLDILKQSNLHLVRKTLVENKNIYLMHNADDMLIDADQLTYLQNIFENDRRKIYPLGGHLGNLWYETNQKDLLQMLDGIKN